MIKKIFSALALVLFATTVVAQSGLTCDDPIPVDKNYQGQVSGPCELWYSAWTYDLPLTVHFIPDDPNSEWGPEVSVDFTCVPGVYEDRNIDSLLNLVEDFGLEFPLELLCDLEVRNGKNEWDLSVNESYREQMAEFGVTYNVPAFVKVTFYESGTVSLKPDSLFKNCMETSKHIVLDDSISIIPNDADQVFVLPYTDWQNDSIQFVWTGEDKLTIWLATYQCDFKPEITDGYVWGYYEVLPGVPYKLQISDIKDAIANNKSGGLFYGKMLSSTSGKLVVEKVPMGAVQGGAQLLKYNERISLQANDTSLFCFPRTWGATQFIASNAADVKMYASNTSNFTMSDSDANILGVFAFSKGAKELLLSSIEMNSMTNQAIDDYIYVRFASTMAITITPKEWHISDCADKSYALQPNISMSIPARSSSTIYRLNYDDFKDAEITIEWSGNSTLPTYIADTCSFTLSSKNARLVLSPAPTIKRNGTYTITAEQVASWSSRVDADGMLYARFNPTNSGSVIFKVNKTTPDPVYTTISETLCYGETYTWNGQTYSATGEYQQTFVAANGADSIVTLKLTILPEVPATTEKAEIIAGETYTWNGKDYTEAGEYTITLQDENGCDYQATLILNVLPPLSPCLQASVKLNVGDELKVNLASAFTVYRIDYNAWMQQAVTLVWTGIEPLHAFVAETCEFALAPYNRYVHAYVPVPAQGDWVLDMDALAPYVDEDGYLYVRFLTEFEGTLRVK